MLKRRLCREWAVQFLFQLDFNPDDPESGLKLFWKDRNASAASREYTETIVNGVLSHRKEIDEVMARELAHWDINRLGHVDRNVMRVGIYEMLYRKDIPPIVSINEAVDIAKRYSADEAGRFVNGVLDKIASSLGRSLREAVDED